MSILSRWFGSTNAAGAANTASQQSLAGINQQPAIQATGILTSNGGAGGTGIYTTTNTSITCTCNAMNGNNTCQLHAGIGVINFPSAATGGNIGVSTSGLIWGSYVALTAEEQQELNALRADYNAELKQIRKNHFKELPLHKRETILIMVQCSKIATSIGAHSPLMSARQSELESKSGSGLNFGTITYSLGVEMLGAQILNTLGLTLEEVENAHAEACAEEMITGDT